jgi:hypothetical protein
MLGGFRNEPRGHGRAEAAVFEIGNRRSLHYHPVFVERGFQAGAAWAVGFRSSKTFGDEASPSVHSL